jgi:hypothetical protein
MDLRYRRNDGSFVAIINGHPYHITQDDPAFEAAQLAADDLGEALPYEDGQDEGTPTLDQVKASLLVLVDAQAELARLKFITGGTGQALEYQQAASEAAAYLAAADAQVDYDPDPAIYPMLSASVGTSDGNTLLEVAQTVSGMHQAWSGVGSAIRGLRLTAKEAVKNADTIVAAQAAAIVEWPEPELKL